MKHKYDIKLIDKQLALSFIRRYHYSNSLPRLNKHFAGFYLNEELVGVVTLGWGTRPVHTIKKLFPSLSTKDYFEIGRMAMTEEMPKNSESQMLSQLSRYIKDNFKEVKLIFTWADGMLGKVGYVYQASNFYYAGFSVTDTYFTEDGVKVHPRQSSKIFNDGKKNARPTFEQLKQFNIKHYKGSQFRYVFFLCSKTEKRKLFKECKVKLNFNYPKEQDLKWKVKNLETGKWEVAEKPSYVSDFNLGDFKNG